MGDSPAEPQHPDTGRLPPLGPDDLHGEARALYDDIVGGTRGAGQQRFVMRRDDGTLAGPFNPMLHAPAVGRPLAALGEALRFRSSLSAEHREIAVLAVAATRRCGYEWYAHERVGRASGLDDTTISALRALAEVDDAEAAPALEEAGDDLVRRVVGEVLRTAALDADLAAEAEMQLGATALVELVVLAGYYDTLATLVGVFAIGVPEGPDPFPTEGDLR